MAVFFMRVAFGDPKVTYPDTLKDWAFTAGRLGFWLATAATTINVASIGRTRLYGLLASVLASLLCLSMLVGLTAY
jgi:hypothetical protein